MAEARQQPGTGSPHLDQLEAWLISDRAPEEAMTLSELDGFLTGIVVGPQPILPSEWLPFVWGDEEPVFADATEAERCSGPSWPVTTRSAVGCRTRRALSRHCS